MKIQNILKSIAPHVLIIALFIAVSFIYFSPVIEKKELPQMDAIHSTGMSHELTRYEQETGEHSLWTNSMFSGMPAYQIKTPKPNSIYYFTTFVLRLGLPYFTVAILFVLLLGFYIMLTVLDVNKWISIIGAIGFAFGSYNFIIISVGHISKAYAIAFMPLVIAGVLLTYKKKYWLGAIITMFGLGIEISANHVQVTYYLLLMIGVYALVRLVYAILEKEIKAFSIASGVLVIAVILAILPNVSNLWVTYEYGNDTIRGESELASTDKKKSTGLDRDYALAWSYGTTETWSLMIPNIQGGKNGRIGEFKYATDAASDEFREAVSQQDTYWGTQPFTSGPVYAGAILCFLFVLGLFLVKGELKCWLAAATILSIFLAWGRNFPAFTDIFFYYVPFYNKFRTVSMAMVIASFTVPMLAALTLQKIIEAPKVLLEKKLYLYISLALTAGISLLFYLMPSAFFTFITGDETRAFQQQMTESPQYKDAILRFMPQLELARISILKHDAIRSFIFIILSAGSIFAFLFVKAFKKEYLIAVISLLVISDMWVINKRYLNDEQFVPKLNVDANFQKSKADEFILKDIDLDYRVLNLTRNPFTEVNTSYFHKSIGGYHGAKMRRYQDLIDKYLGQEIGAVRNIIQKNPEQANMLLSQTGILNMLNAKYLIFNPDALPIINFNALGSAWFVDSFKIVNNADEEFAALKDFNPSHTALIDKRFETNLEELKKSGVDTTKPNLIKLIQYKPDCLVYQSNTKSSKLAVFSEIYYDKGWNCYVDEKLVPHFRVNYVLRGAVLPVGAHKVEFKFEPKSYYNGQKISLISSILVVILLVISIGKFVKDYKYQEETQPIKKIIQKIKK